MIRPSESTAVGLPRNPRDDPNYAARHKQSIRRSQIVSWFQLVKIWLTFFSPSLAVAGGLATAGSCRAHTGSAAS